MMPNIMKRKNLKASSPEPGMVQWYPLGSLLLKILSEIIDRTIRQEKDTK